MKAKRIFEFNGGRGAVLCQTCKVVVVEDLGPDDPIDNAKRRVYKPVTNRAGLVFCSQFCKWIRKSERAAKRYAPLLAQALQRKFFSAYANDDWHDAESHPDDEWWHFSSFGCQIAAHNEYYGESSSETIQPEVFRYALREFKKIQDLPQGVHFKQRRRQVEEALERAHEKWRKKIHLQLQMHANSRHAVAIEALKNGPTDRFDDVPVPRYELERIAELLFIVSRL